MKTALLLVLAFLAATYADVTINLPRDVSTVTNTITMMYYADDSDCAGPSDVNITLQFQECLPVFSNYNKFVSSSANTAQVCVYSDSKCANKIFCGEVNNGDCIDGQDGTSTEYVWQSSGDQTIVCNYYKTDDCTGPSGNYTFPGEGCINSGEGESLSFNTTGNMGTLCGYESANCASGTLYACLTVENGVCDNFNPSLMCYWGSTPPPTPPPVNQNVTCLAYNNSDICYENPYMDIDFTGCYDFEDGVSEMFTEVGEEQAVLCAWDGPGCQGNPLACINITNNLCQYTGGNDSYVCGWGSTPPPTPTPTPSPPIQNMTCYAFGNDTTNNCSGGITEIVGIPINYCFYEDGFYIKSSINGYYGNISYWYTENCQGTPFVTVSLVDGVCEPDFDIYCFWVPPSESTLPAPSSKKSISFY